MLEPSKIQDDDALRCAGDHPRPFEPAHDSDSGLDRDAGHIRQVLTH